jgi:hypothetical protein
MDRVIRREVSSHSYMSIIPEYSGRFKLLKESIAEWNEKGKQVKAMGC